MGSKRFHRGDAVRTRDGHVGIVHAIQRGRYKWCRVGILSTRLSRGSVRCVVDHEEMHRMDTLERGY